MNHDNLVDKGPAPAQTLEIPSANQEKIVSCSGIFTKQGKNI